MSSEEVALRLERTKLLREHFAGLERLAEIERRLDQIEQPETLFEVPAWRRN